MQLAISVGAECFGSGYAHNGMNRIREIREAAGLSQEELAERVGTHANTISRLEIGKIKLTQAWLMSLAEALHCHPADFLQNVVAAEVTAEVEPVIDSRPGVDAAIASRGLKVYRVLARSVVDVGVAPGDIITVDESDQGISSPKIGDIVLVEMGPQRQRALRQFIPPRMLVTNRGGANLAISLDDPTVNPEIVGVVLRGPPALDGVEQAAPDRSQTRPQHRTSDRS